MLLGSLAIFFVNIFQLFFSVYDSDSFKNVDFHNLLCYKINARKMNATRMTQKNLQKHPIHPVIPSPRKEAINPKACTPQPIKPRMTKAITNTPMNPSIAIMSFMLLYRYFFVTVPLCERTYVPMDVLMMISLPLVMMSKILAPLHPQTKLQLLLPIVAL